MKVKALDVNIKVTNYPQPFKDRFAGKLKRPLGDEFGIKKFGVNHTTLKPHSESTLLHHHTLQEEFIYIISGNPTLITTQGECQLEPGDCVGFTPQGPAHRLVNRTEAEVVFLEIGDRVEGDKVTYPEDDLMAVMSSDGKWMLTDKNGRPY